MGKLLRRLRRRLDPPNPEPPQKRRRDPHEPIQYDDPAQHYTPIQRWLYGLDEPRPARRTSQEASPTDSD